jgi:hypothetical protein
MICVERGRARGMTIAFHAAMQDGSLSLLQVGFRPRG